MQIKIFTIPIGAEDTQIEELNNFIRANKIIDVKRELAAIDGRVTGIGTSDPSKSVGIMGQTYLSP